MEPEKPSERDSFPEIFGDLRGRGREHSTVGDPLGALVSSINAFPSPCDPSAASTRSPSLEIPTNGEDPLAVPFQGGSMPHTGQAEAQGAAGRAQLYTEGVGSERSGNVESDGAEHQTDGFTRAMETSTAGGSLRQSLSAACYRKPATYVGGRSRTTVKYPPPISTIGDGGRPLFRLESYKEGGRFVLTPSRLPNQEFLRASREGGKLRLHLIQQGKEGEEEDEVEDDDDDDDDEQKSEDETEENRSQLRSSARISCRISAKEEQGKE